MERKYKRRHFFTDNEKFYSSREVINLFDGREESNSGWIPIKQYENLIKTYNRLVDKINLGK